jgi:DNA-binding GntR family transcriptional regulator
MLKCVTGQALISLVGRAITAIGVEEWRGRSLTTFADVQPARSLAGQAYARLREAIDAGELRPGMRLREEDLAARLEMSRTPLREAVRRLEVEGFFTRDSRTLVVMTLDHQAVSELYAMREVLEGTVAAFAARHASEGEVVLLRDLYAIEAGLLARPQELARHNERFHSALYGAAHNRYLLKALNALRDARALLGASTLQDAGRATQAHAEHDAIVSAVEARDPARAEATARDHIRAAGRERLRRLVQAS